MTGRASDGAKGDAGLQRSAVDVGFLRRALRLASRARGRTAPNPMVGAVLVRDGQVVGEGYHRRAGTAHAEAHALRQAGDAARGATLYVTLEPCSHWGRTPPCCEAVAEAGVARVVTCSRDPNPMVDGRGLAYLRAKGVVVECGTMEEEERELNVAWRHWTATGRPWTTLKLAATLDGRVATRTGESQWITGEAARRDVHRLRAVSDAVLTTSATVVADDPALTVREVKGRDPRRVVVDAALRTSPAARVYDAATHGGPTLLLATCVTDVARHQRYVARGVEVVALPPAAGGVNLEALMDALGERNVLSLMVECGGTFAAALVKAGLVQVVRAYVAPMLIGGGGPSCCEGEGVERLANAVRLENVTWKRLGDDMRMEGRLRGARRDSEAGGAP